jgi:hypothetical protein
MFWAVGFLILFIVALIPILSIVLDSPAGRRMLESRVGDTTKVDELTKKVLVLEDEVHELTRGLESLREETEFMQRLLENPENRQAARRLAPPDHTPTP